MTREPFSIVVLARAQREIDAADRWWLENRENPDAVREQFRRFCELVTVFPEIGTLVASSRVSARRILLPTSSSTSTTASVLEHVASRCSASGMPAEERGPASDSSCRLPTASRCAGFCADPPRSVGSTAQDQERERQPMAKPSTHHGERCSIA